ncbi:MAG: alpha/beta hydrolase [Anaerolineales bacterium]|jgi:pimeloyl-ACP methyl ester carboxylesterase
MTTLETTAFEHQSIVKKAYQAFFSPSQYEVKPRDQKFIKQGNNYRLPFDDGELAVTTWGADGPAILLMHGWGGARAQMTGFVNPLLEAGYRVVAFDQPAHGESDGKMTNILEIAPSMDLIAKREGPFEAVIAHSFGTLITSYVLVNRDFPPPSRLIYLGSFNRLMDSLPRFQVLSGLPDAIIDRLRDMIYTNFGKDVLDAIWNEKMTQGIDIPALMFHDKVDNVTPIKDSRAIARVWKNANLVETEGLGHRGALQSSEVHVQIVNFFKAKK